MEYVEQFYSKTGILYVKLQFHYVSFSVVGVGGAGYKLGPLPSGKGAWPSSCAVLLFDGGDNSPG